jgi:hypothetical protein
LTRSRYFSPTLNAAIFDGPVRIYFAQYQESLALKVYFKFQDRLQTLLDADREQRLKKPHVFVMLYPTEEIFTQSFPIDLSQQKMRVDSFGQDLVIGVCGALENEETEEVFEMIQKFLRQSEPLDTVTPDEMRDRDEMRELDL